MPVADCMVSAPVLNGWWWAFGRASVERVRQRRSPPCHAKLLDRHEDPFALNYCLLEDSQNDWHPFRSAGQLVGKNLRRLLADSAAGVEKITEGEANMAEPVSAQFPVFPLA